MKSFKNYLTESKKSYKFRIKFAMPVSDETMDRIESHLLKYDVNSVTAPKKLMLQSTPYDFPTLKGYEIYIVEFVTDRPASAYQIQIELQNLLSISDGYMKVRAEHEPLEKEQQDAFSAKANETISLLADETYGEAEKINSEDYYGDKYNSKFVQELLALRKNKENENGW